MSRDAPYGRSLLQRLLGTPPEEPLLAQVRAGGSSFRTLVLTRNRRVMISLGDGGRTLRLHECFRAAPPEVLEAVGRFLAPATPPARRDAARARIRDFLAEQRPAAPAAARRPRRVGPRDREHVQRLQAEFDRVNEEHFGGALPRVHLALSGRMRRRNGHFSTAPLEIVISRALCRDAHDGEAEKTLRHEMIHLWQHHEGRKPGHGRDFRRWAARLGIHPRATRQVEWRDEG